MKFDIKDYRKILEKRSKRTTETTAEQIKGRIEK